MSEKIITFENISKSYTDGKKSRIILRNVSGAFEKASLNVILGESGCGKSTFLSILSGIEKPDSGRVLFRGKDIYRMKEAYQSRLRGVFFGIVFQDFNLVDELTAKDNILLPLKINKMPFDKKHFEELIIRLGLSKIQDEYPAALSGGEKQRTAIARAMITRPDVIFADEPTGNLDEKNSQNIARIFTEMNRVYGTCIIVVTHDKKLFGDADNVLEIREGGIY